MEDIRNNNFEEPKKKLIIRKNGNVLIINFEKDKESYRLEIPIPDEETKYSWDQIFKDFLKREMGAGYNEELSLGEIVDFLVDLAKKQNEKPNG